MARVLVVDDAAYTRLKSARVLASGGLEVLEASSGAEALSSFQRQRPGAVLLDLTLPDRDGLHVLDEMLSLDGNARVAVVTALAHRSIVVNALKAGARDFVAKPFSRERLLEAVKKMLR